MSVARGFTGYRGCYHVLDSRDRRATFSLVLDCVTCGFVVIVVVSISHSIVPPLQMCSSANLSASNYEDCKGKKFKLVLTFHQLKDTSQDDRKISITTLRRVNVPLWSHQNKVHSYVTYLLS